MWKLAASITTREEVHGVLIAIAPKKQPRQSISMPTPTVQKNERLLVVRFDGSTRLKWKIGAYRAVVCEHPEWKTLAAAIE